MKAEVIKIQSLTWPVLFFIGGIITVYFDTSNNLGSFLPLYIMILGFLILGGYSLWHRTSYFGWFHIGLIFFYASGCLLATLHAKEFDRYSQKLDLASSSSGVVTKISHFSKMDRVHIRIANFHWWSPPHYFNINLLDKDHTIHKGQVISLSNPLKPITSSSLPFTFDAREYWNLKNTSHETFLYHASDAQILKDSTLPFFERIRQKALAKIDLLYQDDGQSGILKALILGQKGGISPETKESFKNAGLMHILAVSGLHVGIVYALLFMILFPVKLILPRSPVHYLLILAALWFYAALTGMNTPVVRAVILMTFYLTARRIDRQINKWNVFFWAILLVLVIQPKALFSVSFQLSFGAVASILFFYKRFHEWVTPVLGSNYFSGLVAVSLAAQVGIAPLLLIHFQEISLVSTLSSFLVIPLLFPLILVSAVSIIVPASWNWISEGLSFVSRQILDLITGMSDMLASWAFSSQVFAWSTTTIMFLLTALVLFGLYQERTMKNLYPWLNYTAISFIALACISEGLNIYAKRVNPVLATYSYEGQSNIDVYYQGICYTNYKGSPPSFLIRNRKKYYTEKVIQWSEEKDWSELFSALKNISKKPGTHNISRLQIYDYIQNKEYAVDLSRTSDGRLVDTEQKLLPFRTTYNQE